MIIIIIIIIIINNSYNIFKFFKLNNPLGSSFILLLDIFLTYIKKIYNCIIPFN